MTEFLALLNAGGMPALAGGLVYGLRYLAREFSKAQADATAAHQQTIALLRDTIRDNTVAMLEVRTVLTACQTKQTTRGPQ